MEYNWVDQLKKHETDLTRTEQELIDFTNDNPDKVCSVTLKELSELSGISKPVIINCYKKLEYSDYRSFQAAVEQFFSTHIDTLVASKHMQSRVKTIDQLLHEATDVDMRTLDRLRHIVSTEDLKNISRSIGEARSIYVIGQGTGYYPAHYLAQRLRRYGLSALFVEHDCRHIPDMLHPAGENDLLLLFHYSDRDDWLWPVLRLAESRSVKTMLLSGAIHPDYVKKADSFYHIPRGELSFKNSMAVPMHFANQILLSYELIHKREVEVHLTDLEESRHIWDDIDYD